MARCFISWVAPDMTTILKARDKRHEGAVRGRQDQTAKLGHPLKQGGGAVVEGRIGSAAAPKAAAAALTTPRDPLTTAATSASLK